MDAFPDNFNSANLQKRRDAKKVEYRNMQIGLLKNARGELFKKYQNATGDIYFDFQNIGRGLNKESQKQFLLELIERFELIEYGLFDDDYYYSVDKSTLRVLTENDLNNSDVYKSNISFIIRK